MKESILIKNMRKLDSDFEKKLDSDFKPLIDYVKNNKDVFLGIRHNQIILYVNAGKFFEIKRYYNKKYIGSFDKKYYYGIKFPKHIECLIGKEITDISLWLNVLDEIKMQVKSYQERLEKNINLKKVVVTHREKILQQKILNSFNHQNSNYFNYDIEYNLQGIKTYLKDKSGNILKTSSGNDKTLTPGRTDNLVISIPKNNQITLYFMELKDQNGAFGGAKKDSFGSGIVGHIYNYMPIIEAINTDGLYYDEYNKKTINIKNSMLEEIKYAMNFYQKYNLIDNENFKNLDFNNLKIAKAELVIYATGCNSDISFKNHLGLSNKGNAKYNVKELLNGSGDLRYITKEQLSTFKYYLTNKKFSDDNQNTEIKKFKEIKKDDLI